MHSAPILNSATDRSGRFLLTASEDKTARLWDLHQQSLAHTFFSPSERHAPRAVALSADARLGYDISDHLGAFVEGSYEKMFSAHRPTRYTNMNTGALLSQSNVIGGAELDVWTLKAGLKGQF